MHRQPLRPARPLLAGPPLRAPGGARTPARQPLVKPTGLGGAVLLGQGLLLLLLDTGSGRAADAARGYCPIPEPGEEPTCLEPLRERYGDLLEEIDRGALDDQDSERIEAALSEGERPYEALSLVAYAYYVLSKRAATAPHQDPQVARRLEHFNALLRTAYQRHAPGDPFRASVEEAVQDIRRRAPPTTLRCRDARGREKPCTSTEALVRGLRELPERRGIRGALSRLLARILGREPP